MSQIVLNRRRWSAALIGGAVMAWAATAQGRCKACAQNHVVQALRDPFIGDGTALRSQRMFGCFIQQLAIVQPLRSTPMQGLAPAGRKGIKALT